MPDPPQSLGVARYYGSTLPTLAPGNTAVSPCDRRTRPIVASLVQPGLAASQWTPAFTTALVSKFSVVPGVGPGPGGGTLRSIACRIDSSAPSGNVYVLLWNLADVPPDGTAVGPDSLMAPVKIQHVNGVDDNFTLDFDEGGIFGDFFTLCLSTTEFSQTLGGAFLAASASFAATPA